METRALRIFTCLVLLGLLSGCAGLAPANLPTPLPPDFLPTAAAMTLEASGLNPVTIAAPVLDTPAVAFSPPPSTETPALQAPLPAVTASVALTPTQTSTPTQTESPPAIVILDPTMVETSAPAATTGTPAAVPTLPTLPGDPFSLPTLPASTPPPEIPEANVQIFQYGELSLVTSPLNVSTRVWSRNGKTVRIDLNGEDGRLLARHVRTYTPQAVLLIKIGVALEFEIRAAAEQARLTVSVEDRFGRLADINSINLILLSEGRNQINPSSGLWQRIVIQEPAPRTLIQGGKLIVTGRARPNQDQPLKVMLVSEEGKVLGQRLAALTLPIPGDYGNFIAEVPYSVSDLTNALLVVYEDGRPISEIAHLASLQILLAP